MNARKWFVIAIVTALSLLVYSRLNPTRPMLSAPQGNGPIASAPSRESRPALPSSRPEPARYAFLGQDCAVLAVRDEASANPREARRAWLIELAPFGRVRVEETVALADDGREGKILRRDAFV